MNLKRPWTKQPTGNVQIDWSNPIVRKRKLLDAWLPQSMASRSVLGRRPISSEQIGLKGGRFGLGAYGISKSIRYDVGEWGESGPYCFVAICSFISYGSTNSVVRKDGADIPVQIANNTVRSVGWSPVATGDSFFATPASGQKHHVLIVNRESVSTRKMYVDGALVLSNTGFSSYGASANPLCFLGTESDGEIFTAADGLFYGGIAFSDALSDAERASISRNPWQVFRRRRLTFGSVVTVQYARPIADLSNTGWVPSTGTDLYPMIGETVRDDATFIAATFPGALYECTLSSIGDPAVSTGHLPTLVLSAPGGGGITVRLRQSTTTIAAWTYHPGPTPTEYTPTLSGAEADSITDYTALRLQFEAIA